jgi:hypothetical protein
MTLTAAIETGVLLSRHTTLGTGGPARFFARPATLAELATVPGVGAAKLAKYGAAFLAALREADAEPAAPD